MVAADLKAETMNLMEKRSALELEMNIIIDRLCRPGGPGLEGNLVDSEGFPRSDIDIPVVRADRRRLAELRNDHKDITERISQSIQLLHSVKLSPKPVSKESEANSRGIASNVSFARGASSEMDVDVNVSKPFAVVDEISEESPAVEDGLQLGDQIVKFGNVEFSDNLQPQLAAEAQMNLGLPIPVVVIRQGTPINLTVTPRTWQGRGFLGCHFRIL